MTARTYGHWWRAAQRQLEQEGLAPAPREAQEMLLYAAGLDRSALILCETDALPPALQHQLDRLLADRLTGKPLAYVLGGAWFMKRWWPVTRHVLIPRPDTELLVQTALTMLEQGLPMGIVVEVGVGSGVVLGTILLETAEHEDVRNGIGTDISPYALLQAGHGLTEHRIDMPRAELRTGNLLEPVQPEQDGPVALVVSNPPYVSDDEWADLEAGVRDFEPKLALVGDDNSDGLRYYRDLLPQAAAKITAGGALVMEIGWQQGRAVQSLLESNQDADGAPLWTNIQLLQDLAGRDRVVCARRA